ncbi:hypothetical protein CBR_g12525 [Chara braunii]|uniref:2-phosphoglycerate kinase n=1 Tax=Chara braunii TaxID=69332 RepID=A0A388JSQ5_CHABU|nr:hypothetical protein CBR_g12525 [Chara braunii]|eukprot:GBG60787.1 hypothetical protein CBR_g12525 [Chara braunii]
MLVGLLCGEIAKGGRATVAYELLTFLSQRVDDLPTDIISYNRSDLTQAEPVTLVRKLKPTVIWANCTEDYGQYLSDHDPTVWCYLDLDELAPDNFDFDEFCKAHRENGELSSDDDPGRIAIAGLSEEEEEEAWSTSKEEEEASTPKPREAPPARAPPAVRGGSTLNHTTTGDVISSCREGGSRGSSALVRRAKQAEKQKLPHRTKHTAMEDTRTDHRPPRHTTSKYDFVKVKVWLGDHNDHYYVLSRFLVSRTLTLTQIPHVTAIKIALELKKLLVDNSLLDVSQSDLEANLFKLMRRRGFGDEYISRYQMMTRFHHLRVPLIVLVCGTACVGKSTIATQLAQRLNLPNVLQTDMIYELLRTAEDSPLHPEPVWARNLSPEEVLSEFCRECRVVRKGLEGDLAKSMREGKPIIIEGVQIDPAIYLQEMAGILPPLSTASGPNGVVPTPPATIDSLGVLVTPPVPDVCGPGRGPDGDTADASVARRSQQRSDDESSGRGQGEAGSVAIADRAKVGWSSGKGLEEEGRGTPSPSESSGERELQHAGPSSGNVRGSSCATAGSGRFGSVTAQGNGTSGEGDEPEEGGGENGVRKSIERAELGSVDNASEELDEHVGSRCKAEGSVQAALGNSSIGREETEKGAAMEGRTGGGESIEETTGREEDGQLKAGEEGKAELGKDAREDVAVVGKSESSRAECTRRKQVGKHTLKPIIVLIVLKMDEEDHDSLLEEWFGNRMSPPYDGNLAQVRANLRVIQKYLCSFEGQGVATVKVSPTTFSQTLDGLHGFLLQSIEMGCRMQSLKK